MPDPGVIKAGIISKPYGLQGKVNLILEPGAGKKIEEGIPLFIDIDVQRVPFFIEEIEQASQDHLILKLEFLESVEEARKVSGCEVFHNPGIMPAPADEVLDFNSLVGFSAIDATIGSFGTICGFIEHPFNPVFVVEYQSREILIPASGELIERIDHHKQSVFFLLPEGLMEL